jgi:hypothetical protein
VPILFPPSSGTVILKRKMDWVVMAAGTTDYTDFTERIGSMMKDTTCTCPMGEHEGEPNQYHQ